MIIDCHAHVFMHWITATGHPTREIHKRYMQRMITRTVASTFRARDGAKADTKALYRPDDTGWTGLTDVDFRVGKYGQLEFTDKGEDYARGIDFARRKYAALRERCEEEGRPYDQVEKTTLSALIVTRDGVRPEGALPTPEEQALMTPSQAIEYFHQLAEAGTDHAIFNTPIAHLPGAFDVWASDIIPAVEKMVPSGRLGH